MVAGEFTGGELVVPELKVQVALQPNDVIFIRSRLLEHFLAPFSGTRYVFVSFHHASLFEQVDENEEQVHQRVGPETRAMKKNAIHFLGRRNSVFFIVTRPNTRDTIE